MMRAQELRERLGLAADDSGMDSLIEELIQNAEDYVRAYCRLRTDEEIPDFLLAQMVTEDYGRIAGAGLSICSVSGASESYRGEYSADVTAILRGMRHPAAMRRGFIC